MKKMWGSFLFGIARGLDVIIGGLIRGISWVADMVAGVRQLLAPLYACGILLIVLNPFSLLFIRSYAPVLLIMLLIGIIPILGRSFVSALDYGHYIVTEYLYDKADYYRFGKGGNKTFNSYGNEYRRKKRAEEEAAYRRAQQAQNEYWEKIFRDFTQGAGFSGFTYGDAYGGYQHSGAQGGYEGYRQNRQYNPFEDFSAQYRQSCDILGVPYDTDEYAVKLAYRKLAKQYHPDINKAPEATAMFQKISAAYSFLSKETIERYKRMPH